MSKSSTTADTDWLDLPTAGGVLLCEFMEPLELTTDELASALLVDADKLDSARAGKVPIDAELDLRLTRYFQLSEGYFLRIQTRLETLAAKRALNGELDRIMPRAA